MPRWKFDITARKKGALGITLPVYAVERDGDTCEKAVVALYDEYEHISVKRAELVPDKPSESE